jgi:hypothetical protein
MPPRLMAEPGEVPRGFVTRDPFEMRLGPPLPVDEFRRGNRAREVENSRPEQDCPGWVAEAVRTVALITLTPQDVATVDWSGTDDATKRRRLNAWKCRTSAWSYSIKCTSRTLASSAAVSSLPAEPDQRTRGCSQPLDRDRSSPHYGRGRRRDTHSLSWRALRPNVTAAERLRCSSCAALRTASPLARYRSTRSILSCPTRSDTLRG